MIFFRMHIKCVLLLYYLVFDTLLNIMFIVTEFPFRQQQRNNRQFPNNLIFTSNL